MLQLSVIAKLYKSLSKKAKCIDIGNTLWYNIIRVKEGGEKMDEQEIKDLLELLGKALESEIVDKLVITIKPQK